MCADDLVSGKHRRFDNGGVQHVEWSETDYEKAHSLIQNFYRDCVAKTKTSGIEGAPPNVQNVIKDCYEARQGEIFQAVAKDTLLCSGAKNLVENIDWKLKWIMGSSKLSTLREPVLQMNLSCIEKSEANVNVRNVVNFEMNPEQVDKLIDNLEKAKSSISSSTVLQATE